MKLGEDFFNDEFVPAVFLITEVLDYLFAEWTCTNDMGGGVFLDEVLPLMEKIAKLRELRLEKMTTMLNKLEEKRQHDK